MGCRNLGDERQTGPLVARVMLDVAQVAQHSEPGFLFLYQEKFCPDQKCKRRKTKPRSCQLSCSPHTPRGWVTSGDWLAGEIEEGVVLGGTFWENDEPFLPRPEDGQTWPPSSE